MIHACFLCVHIEHIWVVSGLYHMYINCCMWICLYWHLLFVLALVLVYDYHAGADTLLHKHFNHKSLPLSEAVIWQYVIQLTSALRTLHHSGLAVRCIDMSKVLVLGSNRYVCGVIIFMAYNKSMPYDYYILYNNRVWFNCCGLVDVITYDITTSEDQPQAVKQNQV